MTTVPDLAYTAAGLTGLASGFLSIASTLIALYGMWTRENRTMDKSKDLLAVAKDARNVFLAFLAILILTVSPSIKVNDMVVAEAVATLTQQYCTFMIVTLIGAFVCSVAGVIRGPVTQATKDYIATIRWHALIFAILGMLMTYVVSLA